MFVYIDETGNTGLNMFDEEQSFFLNLAVLTNEDFDVAYSKEFEKILLNLNLKFLHAKNLTSSQKNLVAKEILDIISQSDIKFVAMDVDKKFHAATILFDTIFDAGENEAVPWRSYWVKEFRLVLLLNFINLVSDDILKLFWNKCLLSKNSTQGEVSFTDVLLRLQTNLGKMPLDHRTVQIFTDSFDWAIKNSNKVTYTSMSDNFMYTPNVCFLWGILSQIDESLDMWQSKDCHIIHDQQQEFQSLLEDFHKLYSSNTTPIFLEGIITKNKKKFRVLEGSNLTFKSSENSYGVQTCDICLSVISRFKRDKHLRDNEINLLEFIGENTLSVRRQYHESLIEDVSMFCHEMYNADIPQKKIDEAKNFIALENNRIKRLKT